MIRTLATAAAFALALSACGSNEDAAVETVGNEYDAEAPSLEEVATESEMDALEAQEEAIESEVTPAPTGIDETEVTGDNAETEDVVGL